MQPSEPVSINQRSQAEARLPTRLARPWRWRSIKFTIAGGMLLLVAMVVAFSQQSQQWTEQAQMDFLKRHWQVPVAPQGQPPAAFSALEASLDPASCGACHPTQFEDWKTTIHSRSVGPGLLGQMPALLRDDPETAMMCLSCHAPLAEQQQLLPTGSTLKKNRRFDTALQKQGLTCAGCHVRNYQRFGPPRRDGSLESAIPRDQAPHGGATRTPAFERAEFCMGCHQFEEGDRALNGKLLENTYNEWKSSPYAKRGIACQQCHMPDRRHLWRGIHDPEMVKRGVTIELRTNQPHYAVGDKLEATLALTNSGVGHYFPSYVTPKVILRMELLDASGRPIAGSAQQEAVGREVTLDLSEEIYDTRIPPKGTHTMTYIRPIDRPGVRLKAVVVVYPDEFYRRFYEATLAGSPPMKQRLLLRQALAEAKRSGYKIFEKEVPLS